MICMAMSTAGTLGCSGGSSPATNSSSVLSGVLAELNDGGKFFTFAYVDVPPEGRLLKISALSSSREPCLLFRGPDSPPSKPEDGWYLDRDVSGIPRVRTR